MALAHQAQDLAFARRQVGEFGLPLRRALRRADLRQFFNDAAAEPRGILHDRLDRLHQLDLAALALGDVLDRRQHARLVLDGHRRGRHQAVQKRAVARAQRHFLAVHAGALLQRCHGAVIGLGVCPQQRQRVFVASKRLGVIARCGDEGIVDLQQPAFRGAERHGHGRQPERRGEALLAIAQRRLDLAPRLQVVEGEQHAGLVRHFDGLAGHHHQLGAAVLHRNNGFHLRNRRPFRQPVQRVLALRRVSQNVQLAQRLAQHLLARVAGHGQKAVIDLDVAQVRQRADHGRRGIRAEGALEAFFRAVLLGHVQQHQHHAFNRALRIAQYQVAHLQHAAEFRIAPAAHFHHHILVGLARQGPVQRILRCAQCAAVAVAQRECLAVAGGRAAQCGQLRHAMHSQRGVIGPDDAAVLVQQDDALDQAVDDFQQMAAFRRERRGGLLHSGSWLGKR
ncbi:hypothetical protein FQZ97_558840 [compost metagenome]